MAEGHVAHRAAALAWLSPSAPRFAALAEGASAHLEGDPASVLLMLRFSRPSATIENISIERQAFCQSSVLEAARVYLESHQNGWQDPTLPVISTILSFSRLVSGKAGALAAVAKTVSPSAARVAGLLAPLGWLACATISPSLVEATLDHDDFIVNPAAIERDRLGLSIDAVTRRLANRWRLPLWLSDTISTLRLPVSDAVTLGADRELSKILRFAIETVECQTGTLGLLGKCSTLPMQAAIPTEEFATCGIDAATDPCAVALLPSLLRLAARAHRNDGSSRVHQIESQLDAMQAALQQTRDEFDRALRDAKLDALAELAAGAGHEINNPLAVISGNAQLLRSREADPDRRHSLDVIVRQTGRIADLLQDLMQFARPSKAQAKLLSVNELFVAVEREVSPIAVLKAVTLRVSVSDSIVTGDPRQLKRALGNLMRNAIEVTPTGGVVRLYSRKRAAAFEILVDDSGPGPSEDSISHLFDPFFSGRSAGRGRGLGLSTAWQYAKQNNGDLRFERTEDGLTRFVLSLPIVHEASRSERLSA